MSGTTSEQAHDVYTMPPERYRMGTRAPLRAPSPASGPAPSGPERARVATRRRAWWDIALSVVLSLLLIGAAVLGSFGAILLALAPGSCTGDGRVCQSDLRGLGIWISFTVPWLVTVLSLTATVVLLVRRRRGSWVPLAGLMLAVVAWAVGGLLLWVAG